MPRSTVLVFDRYAELTAEMVGQIREVVDETANEIEQDVKGKAPTSYADAPDNGGPLAAPYKTGNLRRSYHTERHFQGADMYAEIGNDPNVADYAVYLEYGTSRMAPRPHLTPSSEHQRAPFLAKIAAIVSGRFRL